MKKYIFISVTIISVIFLSVIYAKYPYLQLKVSCKNEYCECIAKYANSKLNREQMKFFTAMVKNKTAGDYIQMNALSNDPIVNVLRNSYFVCE